jgi:hypothetical protein
LLRWPSPADTKKKMDAKNCIFKIGERWTVNCCISVPSDAISRDENLQSYYII